MIYVMGGSGKPNATLTINGVAGSSVAATNNLTGKIKTGTCGNDGKCILKGLQEGTWSITMTNGTKTTSSTIVIDTTYEKEMVYELVIYDGSGLDGWAYASGSGGSVVYDDSNHALKLHNANGTAGSPCRFLRKDSGGTATSYNLTNFTKVDFEVLVSEQPYDSYATTFFVSSDNKGETSVVSKYGSWKDPTREHIQLDVSQLSGNYYIGITTRGTAFSYCYKITLI